ncbi:MAG: flagellar basal body-associated FliL family protein [Sphingomonadaceae bacterium]
MPDEKTTAEPTKKKGGFMKLVLLTIVLLGAGGGGTYTAFAMGLIGTSPVEHDDGKPHLILKGEEDPYAVTEEKDKAPAVVFGTGGSKYRTAYFNFHDDFTSNLADSTALIQISLAASTNYDGRVLMWLGEHETAIRSRILVELAATNEADIEGADGKKQLKKRLTKAINDVLKEHEGFGGVNDVYFRSFIIQ